MAPIQAIYGIPKVRVGVQIADGAYVPEGTDTTGSTFTIVETDPGGAFRETYTCATGSQPEGDRQLTFCPESYTGTPGDTFTITQLTAAPGFEVDPQPAIVGPCLVAVAGEICGGAVQDVILIDGVAPPSAADDEASVANTASVDVAVLTNDDTQGAPILSLDVTEPATNGTAEAIAGDPDFLIRYTPNPGFVGTDTFGYTYATVNGTGTATVTVTVTGEVVPPGPSYGTQNVRVGVQILDGAHPPDGTTTAGSTVTLVRSGPDESAEPRTSECTTDAAAPGGTVSYCPENVTLAPGERLEITQTTAGSGLVLNPEPIVVPPCEDVATFRAVAVAVLPTCEDKDAIIVDGVPPTAADDEATVDNLTYVLVDVLANDDTQGAPGLTMDITRSPEHGGMSWNPDNPENPVLYDPVNGFVGTDSFEYTYTTAYGSATGTVTVEVTGEEFPPPPNYGFQKIRVGVQIADGSYVPEGTTAAGSKLTIVQTRDEEPFLPFTTECTTVEPDPGSSIAYCPGTILGSPGYTVEVTQTTAVPGLVLNPDPVVIPPCAFPPVVSDTNSIAAPPTCEQKEAVIIDGGLPPIAADDSDSIDNQASTDVAVLANDDTRGAPVLSLAVSEAPADGTARVIGDGADGVVRYTPAAGFIGTDSFDYTYRTANGSATATVTIRVTGETPTDDEHKHKHKKKKHHSDHHTDDTDDLAETGSPAGVGLSAGFGLLFTAAGAALLARRRRTARRHD